MGWTSLCWRRGCIVEGDIVSTLQEHRFRCVPERRGTAASLEQEIVHALGHFLGLEHARTGIMVPVNYGIAVGPGALEGLRALYGR